MNKVNVPKLRFKGFEGEWEVKKFSVLLKEGRLGGNYENSESNTGIPVIKMGNVGRGKININKVQSLPEDFEYNKDDVLIKGDLLFNTRNTLELVGKVSIWREELPFALYNSNLMRMKFNDEIESSNIFMNYNFNTKKSIIQLRRFATGTTSVAAIYGKDLKSFNVDFPSLPEQQKIASFLTAVDEKIQQLSRKKKLLEQYKKGVMQQLFSGKLRFKDDNGKDYADWEEKKLGEIGETFNGLTGKTKDDFGNGKPYIQYKQIFDSSRIDMSKFELVNVDINEKQNAVKFGDVFFTISSETPSEIGTASVLLDDIEELYLNSFCFGFRANSLDLLSPYFSRYLFRNEIFRNGIVKLAQGSTRYNMSKIQLMKLKINVPAIKEQQKIANFLSNIDIKIENTNQEINQMKNFKKGLLQQMFV